MESVIIVLSALSIYRLLTFRTGVNQRIKPAFNLLALFFVVMFTLQLYHAHHAHIVNLIATILFSIPIISCDGNVSEAWKEVRGGLYKIKRYF